MICLRDELPIVLITNIKLKIFIKGYHVYKEIWIASSWKFSIEIGNPKVNLNKYIVGHLKKGARRRFTETIFFFLLSDPYSNPLYKSLIKVVVLEMSLHNRVLMSRQNI